MKVLAIVKLYAHKNKAGGELYLHFLLKEFIKDHKINVVIPNQKEIKLYEYEEISIAETNEPDYLKYIEQADLVISQLDESIKVMRECKKRNKKAMLILHSYIEYYNEFTKDLDIIKVFNANHVRDDYIKNLKGESFVVYPFTNYPELTKYSCKDLEFRQFITFINPTMSKGVDVIFALAEKFPKKLFLIVLGGYYPHLQKKKQLPNVIYHKTTTNIVNDIYLKSKIVIQPSRFETYGMVASEAMALGIPVIVNSKSPGLMENVGKLSLSAPTPDKEANKRNIKEYADLITLLEHKETYTLWSDYSLLKAKERYIEQQNQVYNLMRTTMKDMLVNPSD
jgi:glycosyltransferase involved in cell wall biosynthesis